MTFLKHYGMAVLMAASFALSGHAQVGNSVSRGYANDGFEGFDKVDEDTSIPQKSRSFWRSLDAKTPAGQLEYACKQAALGRDKAACKAYDVLVCEWPTTPEAAQAQLEVARLCEKMEKFDKAFDEYQYLIVHYAGNCPYAEVLDRQFRIANYLLHNNTSMFGWILNGMDTIRGRFEQIVRNAPRSAIAPEVMLIIGSIRVSEGERQEAISVYDGILNRFPGTPQAMASAYLAAQCRYELAVKHNYNETRCREAMAFFKSALARYPDHPQKAQMSAWVKELTALLLEQNYQQALFYDTKQRNVEAAKTAYRRFLTEFADSKYAPQVRNRLTELEKGAAPLKK